MGRWLDHSVTTDVQAPVDRVWGVWSDLEAMPKWMRWIESVKTLEDPDLTDWTLAAQGFRFHWKARITQRVEAQQLHWESVGGLPTKGAVRFYPDTGDRTVVKLSVSYELPMVLAPLMEPSILGGIVTKELQANLDRYRVIMDSMTTYEKDEPAKIKADRIRRIARGSGVKEKDVRELIGQWNRSRKMMKGMSGNRKMNKQMKRMMRDSEMDFDGLEM